MSSTAGKRTRVLILDALDLSKVRWPNLCRYHVSRKMPPLQYTVLTFSWNANTRGNLRKVRHLVAPSIYMHNHHENRGGIGLTAFDLHLSQVYSFANNFSGWVNLRQRCSCIRDTIIYPSLTGANKKRACCPFPMSLHLCFCLSVPSWHLARDLSSCWRSHSFASRISLHLTIRRKRLCESRSCNSHWSTLVTLHESARDTWERLHAHHVGHSPLIASY
jgi:hypothetical protein